MKILSCVLLSLCIKASTTGYCSPVVNRDDSLEIRINALLKEYDNLKKPGLLLGIIDNGKLIFKKAYGSANIKKNIPNNYSVKYNVASVSKQFTAAAIMKLVLEQKISLNDDIHKYLPSFPDYGTPITIDNLLYHTSGIRDYMVLMWLTGISFEDPFTNKDALQLITKQKELNFKPGTRCVYSNANYILLAEIVEKVTSLTLSEYAQTNLFEQLGMNETGFGKSQSEIALSYGTTEKRYIPYKNNNTAIGDGGLYTTLNDLLKWDAQFYDSTSLNHKLLTLGKLNNGNPLSYGMGIMTGRYRNETIQMHPGAFLGYRAELLRFPKKGISIICLGNTEDINPETITRQISDIYVFGDKGIEGETQKPTYNLKAIETIEGKYEVAPGVLIDIKFENGLLTGQATGQPKQILYPYTKNFYIIGRTADTVSFSENDKGDVNQLTIVQKQGNTIAKKLELVSDNIPDYAGKYYSTEQDATYSFYIKENALWFKVGTSQPNKIEILKKYDRAYFGYKNLEQATIDFTRNDLGKIVGFTLSSGRISGFKFIKQ